VLLLGAVVRVEETVTNDSPEPLEVMWSHHPAFGAPFLGGGCVLSAGCTTFLADDRQPGTLFGAGTSHRWPLARSVAGDTVDLRTIPPPSQPRAVLGYLTDFSSGFFALTNPRLGLGVGLRWDTDVLDKAWLWQEVCSGQDWPWFRRAYVVAVEPASTIPGQGMTNARAKGQAGVRLGAGESKRLVVEAVLYRGSTGVSGIDEGGRVQFEDR
jgi:hypothetical protein